VIRRGDSLTDMRWDLQLNSTGELNNSHLRARCRKYTGPIAMSDLHGKVTSIGEEWCYTIWNNGNRGNIHNIYNPGYLADGSEWDYAVNLGPNGARDGMEMYANRYTPAPSSDVGGGFGVTNIYEADPGNYRLQLQITQQDQPGPLRFGVVEIIGSQQPYLGGNIQYLYRESTRLGNPLVVDQTITVNPGFQYICPQFTAVVKGSGPSFVGTTSRVDYLEITKI
jgi:hypothetical protein